MKGQNNITVKKFKKIMWLLKGYTWYLSHALHCRWCTRKIVWGGGEGFPKCHENVQDYGCDLAVSFIYSLNFWGFSGCHMQCMPKAMHTQGRMIEEEQGKWRSQLSSTIFPRWGFLWLQTQTTLQFFTFCVCITFFVLCIIYVYPSHLTRNTSLITYGW